VATREEPESVFEQARAIILEQSELAPQREKLFIAATLERFKSQCSTRASTCHGIIVGSGKYCSWEHDLLTHRQVILVA
jgi:hypothetical protein